MNAVDRPVSSVTYFHCGKSKALVDGERGGYMWSRIGAAPSRQMLRKTCVELIGGCGGGDDDDDDDDGGGGGADGDDGKAQTGAMQEADIPAPNALTLSFGTMVTTKSALATACAALAAASPPAATSNCSKVTTAIADKCLQTISRVLLSPAGQPR